MEFLSIRAARMGWVAHTCAQHWAMAQRSRQIAQHKFHTPSKWPITQAQKPTPTEGHFGWGLFLNVKVKVVKAGQHTLQMAQHRPNILSKWPNISPKANPNRSETSGGVRSGVRWMVVGWPVRCAVFEEQLRAQREEWCGMSVVWHEWCEMSGGVRRLVEWAVGEEGREMRGGVMSGAIRVVSNEYSARWLARRDERCERSGATQALGRWAPWDERNVTRGGVMNGVRWAVV